MLTDYEQINSLLARYCFVVDTGDAEEIAGLFWENAEVDFNGSVNSGANEMQKGFRRWIEKYRDPVVGLRHTIHLPVIDLDGDTATAKMYYDADGHSRRRGRLISLRGVYVDRLEKRQGEWRFAKRTVSIFRSMLDHYPSEASKA